MVGFPEENPIGDATERIVRELLVGRPGVDYDSMDEREMFLFAGLCVGAKLGHMLVERGKTSEEIATAFTNVEHTLLEMGRDGILEAIKEGQG